mmetsp:Transcript_51045/g.150490  ORF Transcript_51045/g.150490 Transcript_51045/m.150490 type:complete len:205 (-) Transcript_51045:220-834(-)
MVGGGRRPQQGPRDVPHPEEVDRRLQGQGGCRGGPGAQVLQQRHPALPPRPAVAGGREEGRSQDPAGEGDGADAPGQGLCPLPPALRRRRRGEHAGEREEGPGRGAPAAEGRPRGQREPREREPEVRVPEADPAGLHPGVGRHRGAVGAGRGHEAETRRHGTQERRRPHQPHGGQREPEEGGCGDRGSAEGAPGRGRHGLGGEA